MSPQPGAMERACSQTLAETKLLTGLSFTSVICSYSYDCRAVVRVKDDRPGAKNHQPLAVFASAAQLLQSCPGCATP